MFPNQSDQDRIYFNLHDQKKQYQHHIDTELIPFPASCIQIPDNVKNSCYTKVDAMLPRAKGSQCGLLYEDLSLAKKIEHLEQRLNENSWNCNRILKKSFKTWGI